MGQRHLCVCLIFFLILGADHVEADAARDGNLQVTQRLVRPQIIVN